MKCIHCGCLIEGDLESVARQERTGWCHRSQWTCVDSLQRERDHYRDALLAYGQHTDACWGQQSQVDRTCVCGLDAAKRITSERSK